MSLWHLEKLMFRCLKVLYKIEPYFFASIFAHKNIFSKILEFSQINSDATVYYQNPANFNKNRVTTLVVGPRCNLAKLGFLLLFFLFSRYLQYRCSHVQDALANALNLDEKRKKTRRECFSAILFSVENFISRKSHPRLFCFFLVFKSLLHLLCARLFFL